MRVPIRKSGKYTNINQDPFLTKEKFSELKNKLTKLKVGQPRLITEVKRLASDGDFSENAAYQIAKGRLRSLNERIMEIEELLKHAVIIGHSGSSDCVRLGCRVTVLFNGQERTYLILGSAETNPSSGVISRHSPLGMALLGRKVGERGKVKLAKKQVEYEIIGIK